VVTAQRVNTDNLRAHEAEIEEQLDDVRARVASYPDLLHAARERAVYAGKRRPGGDLTGEIRKLAEKERKDVASLRELQGELAAVQSVLAAEAQRQAEESLVEIREQDETFRERQTELVKEAGKVFASLVAIYNDLIESFEQHDQARDKVRRKLPPNLAEVLDAGGSFLAVSPTPVTFVSFLRMLREAATDSNYRAGVAGGGVRFDERDVLVRAVPDLRGKIRRAELSGYTNRTEV
jgi:hypothetical protein